MHLLFNIDINHFDVYWQLCVTAYLENSTESVDKKPDFKTLDCISISVRKLPVIAFCRH